MTRNRLINLGMLYMLLGATTFSILNSLLKWLSTHITIDENLFFRGLTMSLFVLLFMFLRNRKKTHKHQNKKGGWGKLAIRAFLETLSLYSLLYNISTIPLGTSVAFAQSTPIYTAIFAWLFLKEKPTLAVIISVVIGFCGVLLISNPDTSNLTPLNIVCGISSGLCAALSFISIRALRGYFDDLTIVFSFGVVCTLCGLLLVIFRQDSWSVLDFKDYFFIVLVGITGTLGQYFITRAYTFAPVALVSPIDYTRIAFSLLLGIALGDTLPNLPSLVGMLFIILSGIFVALPMMKFSKNKDKK